MKKVLPLSFGGLLSFVQPTFAATTCESIRVGGVVAVDGSNDNREVIRHAFSVSGKSGVLIVDSDLGVREVSAAESKFEIGQPLAIIQVDGSQIRLIQKAGSLIVSISNDQASSTLSLPTLGFALVCH